MPKNPERATRGGDVSGTTKTDNDWGVGAATTVADASYEPGYDSVDRSMEVGYVTMADVKQGYCSYGIGAGMARPKGLVGGR